MNPIVAAISVVLLASSALSDSDYYCPKPEVPSYGRISKGYRSSYRVGDVVEYVCSSGYKLWGKSSIACVKRGKIEYWDGSPPECKKADCGYLKTPDYGYVRHTGTKVGSKATYSCKRGYKLKGDSIRRCQYNGYWSGDEPECKPAGCDYLDNPDYGKVEHDGVHVGAEATYSCDYGYKLVGHSVRKCQYNGYWGGKEPKCVKSGCGYLDDPDYGKVEHKGTDVGDKATYSCDYGYKLKGKSVRKCQYNGYWSGDEPICEKSGCKELYDPEYGKVEHDGTHVGAKASYSCDYGYKLVGSRKRKCQYNGYWSGREPTCKKTGCKDLYDPEYGKVEHDGTHVGAKATYSCDYGYKLVGKHQLTCQYDGYWSDDAPICKKISCKDLKHPDYGKVEHDGTHAGAKATYSCDYGYKLVGKHQLLCEYNGYWSDDAPICEKIGCKDLKHPDYGKVEHDGTHAGAKATYSCDYGYKLVGKHQLTCQYDGYWSDDAPICEKKTSGCKDLRDPDYGKVEHYGTKVGTKATYSCDYGYKLKGDSVRRCQYNGYWSGDEPICVKKTSGCKYLRDPDYGKVKHYGTQVGDKATYSCDYGYKLKGDSVRKCQYNGYWSGTEPKCLRAGKCEKLSDPYYGSVSVYGSYAYYRCDSGYRRVGSYYRRCKNGYWSGSAPTCEKKY